MSTYDGSMILPDLKQYSDQPTFNTKAVVLQTGVPAPTLRAWERRYALLVPERADNAYRLYSERHVALIRWLKERVDSGISISQAAALFRHLAERQQHEEQELHPATKAAEVSFDNPSDNAPTYEVSLTSPEHDATLLPSLSSYSHTPAKNTYPTGYNMRVTKGQLIEIFQDMDEQAAHISMGYVFSLYSVEEVCCELIIPTLQDIGSLWAQGKLTSSVEHFASNFFRAILTNLFHATRRSIDGPRVVTCCAPGELHELAILILSLFLRRNGMCVFYLGQNIETVALLHTIKQLAPVAVCLSLTQHSFMPNVKNLAREIHALPERRPLLFCGGQAFGDIPQPEKLIPEGIYMNGDLQEITTRIQALVQKQLVKQSVR
jgi:DNA-binding transcriptional MerR regulator/methanogenic corrinoid protein MtbC1